MDRIFPVTAPYGAGTINPTITGIPPRGRLGPNYFKRLDGRLKLVIDQAAVALAIDGRRMMEAIQRLTLTPAGGGTPLINNLRGSTIRFLQWPLTRRAPLDPADIAANPGGAGLQTTVEIPFTLYFEDPRALDEKDGGVPTPFIAGGALTVAWQIASYFGTGNTINAASALYVDFVYGERFDVSIGERVTYEEVGVTTWENQAVPPGQLTDQLLVPISGAPSIAFDDTSFATLTTNEDGDGIFQNVPPGDAIDSFNHAMISDALGQMPALDAAQTEAIPLIWPGAQNYTMGDRAYAASGFNILATVGAGNPDTRSYVYAQRRVLDADNTNGAQQINAAAPDVSVGAAQLGLQLATRLPPDAGHNLVKVATDSQVPITHAGPKGAIFGRFMRRVVNPTNIKAAAMEAAKGATPAK